jgi:hypothetical protein
MTIRALALSCLLAVPVPAGAAEPAAKPFKIEYYYKVRWGSFGEFVKLFEKNHFPILKREKEAGRILDVRAAVPRYHGTEDGRWDYRVTIVWKDAATQASEWPDQERVTRELYPDKAVFDAEEQRRFELLLAHWDLPVVDAELGK